MNDLRVDMDPSGTDHPLVTLNIHTPAGTLLLMATATLEAGILTLSGLNIEGLSANAIGPGNLLRLARLVMLELNVNEIVIQGAIRASGAAPGRTPQRFRITRGP